MKYKKLARKPARKTAGFQKNTYIMRFEGTSIYCFYAKNQAKLKTNKKSRQRSYRLCWSIQHGGPQAGILDIRLGPGSQEDVCT